MPVNKRLSRGFTILGAYTFSKNTGLTSSQGEGSLGTRDPSNWNLDKGILYEDRPQLLAVSSVWAVPSGFARGPAKAIFGGWELTGILTATGGAPLTVRAGADRSLNGQGLDTADVIADWRLSGSCSRQEQMNAWFNKSAFALPPIGTVGTGSLNMMRGPGRLQSGPRSLPQLQSRRAAADPVSRRVLQRLQPHPSRQPEYHVYQRQLRQNPRYRRPACRRTGPETELLIRDGRRRTRAIVRADSTSFWQRCFAPRSYGITGNSTCDGCASE